MQNNRKKYEQELEELQQEHEELNSIIDSPDESQKFSEFTLQKLKKRKLAVKDKITALRTFLNPNIIA